ncbi:MAG: hypothetical protein ABII24_02155 [bacterium]
MAKDKPKHQLSKSYARATLIFVILVVIVAAAVLYIALSRTTITITPRSQELSVQVSLTVREVDDQESDEPLPASTITGKILSSTETRQDTFTGLGTGTMVPDVAIGKVTIHNEWSQVQPLAATTRLLSESGVLFRLKNREDVLPGQTIEAEIYADETGEIGNIEPTRFTLPGLWPGLQEKIYAISDQPMTGGLKEVKSVSAEDLRMAEQNLREQIVEQVRTDFQLELSDSPELYELLDESLFGTVIDKEFSAEVGDQADSFTGELTLRVNGLALLPSELSAITSQMIESKIPDYFLAASSNLQNIEVTLEKLNQDTRTAEITVQGDLLSIITLAHPMFDASNLVNRDEQAIRTYFSGFSEVASVEIDKPFWTARTSSLEDRIDVKMTDPVE